MLYFELRTITSIPFSKKLAVDRSFTCPLKVIVFRVKQSGPLSNLIFVVNSHCTFCGAPFNGWLNTAEQYFGRKFPN